VLATVQEDLEVVKQDLMQFKERVLSLEFDVETIKNPVPNYEPTQLDSEQDMMTDYSGQHSSFNENNLVNVTEREWGSSRLYVNPQDKLMAELESKDKKISELDNKITQMMDMLAKVTPQVTPQQ